MVVGSTLGGSLELGGGFGGEGELAVLVRKIVPCENSPTFLFSAGVLSSHLAPLSAGG